MLMMGLLVCTLLSTSVQAQGSLDSLWAQADLAETDTAAIRLRLLAAAELMDQEVDSGLPLSQQLLEQATGLHYEYGMGEANRCVATAYWYAGDLDTAFFYFDRARQQFERTQGQAPQTDVGLVKNSLWRSSLALVDIGIRLQHFEYVQALMAKIDQAPLPTDNVDHIGRYRYHKGYLYSKMRDYERSVQYCLEMLDSVEGPLPATYIWDLNAYSLLGGSFEELDDLANSKKYYDKCMALGEQRDFASWVVNPLRSNYAKFLLEHADAPELGGDQETVRVANVEQAAQIMRRLVLAPGETAYNHALYLHRLAEAFYYQSQYDSAVYYHGQSADWFRANDYNGPLGTVLLNLSNCELEAGNLESALGHATEGLALVRADGNTFMERFGHQTCYSVYKELNQPALSLHHHERFKQLSDSISKEERIVKINDLEAKVELRQTEGELALNQKELELAEEVSTAKSYFLIATAVGLLALLALVLLLLRTNKQRKRSNAQLIEQQQIIQKNLGEKEVLIREVHHRVKNNLQVVGGMLHLQARRLKDPRLDVALQDAQDRIHSMAKVHELFYKGDELVDIPFRDYLTALCDDIASFYKGSNIAIDLSINTEHDRFNIDQTIPMGIIVSELISNAYKHAFKEAKGGTILIELNQLPDGLTQLAVTDSGIGLPDDFDPKKSKSMGLMLVRSLSKQLLGKLLYTNVNGARFAVQFPKA